MKEILGVSTLSGANYPVYAREFSNPGCRWHLCSPSWSPVVSTDADSSSFEDVLSIRLRLLCDVEIVILKPVKGEESSRFYPTAFPGDHPKSIDTGTAVCPACLNYWVKQNERTEPFSDYKGLYSKYVSSKGEAFARLSHISNTFTGTPCCDLRNNINGDFDDPFELSSLHFFRAPVPGDSVCPVCKENDGLKDVNPAGLKFLAEQNKKSEANSPVASKQASNTGEAISLSMNLFTFKGGSSYKFWEIGFTVSGSKSVVHTHWGRIGTTGQWQHKETPSNAVYAIIRDRTEEKESKGYHDEGFHMVVLPGAMQEIKASAPAATHSHMEDYLSSPPKEPTNKRLPEYGRIRRAMEFDD